MIIHFPNYKTSFSVAQLKIEYIFEFHHKQREGRVRILLFYNRSLSKQEEVIDRNVALQSHTFAIGMIEEGVINETVNMSKQSSTNGSLGSTVVRNLFKTYCVLLDRL